MAPIQLSKKWPKGGASALQSVAPNFDRVNSFFQTQIKPRNIFLWVRMMFYALRVEQQSSIFYSKMIILPNSIDDVMLLLVVGIFIEKQIHIKKNFDMLGHFIHQ